MLQSQILTMVGSSSAPPAVAFIGIFLVTISLASSYGDPPPPPSKDFDCAARKFALEFAQSKLKWSSDASGHVYDALRLHEFSVDRFGIDFEQQKWRLENQRRDLSTSDSTSTAGSRKKIFVDASNGSDDADADGSIHNPLRTLVAARHFARSVNSTDISDRPIILLRGGRHHLDETLKLDERDSGITIEAYDDEKVILSGGDNLSLTFFPTEDPRIYSANLSEQVDKNRHYDFTFLFKQSENGQDDERLVWAREPNGHPERDQQPDGYATAQGRGSANMWPGPEAGDGIHIPVREPRRNSTVYPVFGEDLDPRGGGNWYHIGGDSIRFANHGFWNGSVPLGLRYNSSKFNVTAWTPQGYDGAIAHVFHNALWGNWQFPVLSVTPSKQQIDFHHGGWQEGRGGDIRSNPFFVEGVREALDSPGEWWLDRKQQLLYYYPFSNETTTDDDGNHRLKMNFVAPRLKRLIEISSASESNPTRNVTLQGITFAHTATTFLDKYEVPSPGDWSIRRDGALFAENAEGFRVDRCRFVRTGGNAIFLSGHVKASLISQSEFAWIGDSAIASVGKLDLVDGFTVNTYPEDVTIVANHFREIGIHGKQTSALFSALSCRIQFLDNVLYNGPRAGINLNDAFCHGHRIKGNLLFNWVRETQDHGPINTWNRAMYVQKEQETGQPTTTMEWAYIDRNLIMNGPSGNRDLGNLFPAIDNDDGSSHFLITRNFLIYGGAKNYLGQDKIWSQNMIAYPGRWSGDPCAQLWAGKNNQFEGNTCIVGAGNEPIGLDSTTEGFECVIDWNNASALEFVGKTSNNTYYLEEGIDDWGFSCGNATAKQHFFRFDEMKKHGFERNSSVHKSRKLAVEDIIDEARRLLSSSSSSST